MPPGRLSAFDEYEPALLPFAQESLGRDQERLVLLYGLVVETGFIGYLSYRLASTIQPRTLSSVLQLVDTVANFLVRIAQVDHRPSSDLLEKIVRDAVVLGGEDHRLLAGRELQDRAVALLEPRVRQHERAQIPKDSRAVRDAIVVVPEPRDLPGQH